MHLKLAALFINACPLSARVKTESGMHLGTEKVTDSKSLFAAPRNETALPNGPVKARDG